MSEKKMRWVLVSDGTPQIFYAGQTELNDDAIREAVRQNDIIHLKETRAMRTIVIPTPQGVNQSNMLTPVSICRGGVDLHIKPTSWFWPDQDDEAYKVLLGQLDKCGYAEVKHRAAKAGIVTPDGMKTQGGGRIIS